MPTRSIKAPQDRERFHRARDERRAHAYALQICECLFPLERAETRTQHPEECPAHAFLLKRAEMRQVFAITTGECHPNGDRRIPNGKTRPPLDAKGWPTDVADAGGRDAPLTIDQVKEALAIGAKESAAARRSQKRRGRW